MHKVGRNNRELTRACEFLIVLSVNSMVHMQRLRLGPGVCRRLHVCTTTACQPYTHAYYTKLHYTKAYSFNCGLLCCICSNIRWIVKSPIENHSQLKMCVSVAVCPRFPPLPPSVAACIASTYQDVKRMRQTRHVLYSCAIHRSRIHKEAMYSCSLAIYIILDTA